MKKSVIWLSALSLLAIAVYFFENPLLAHSSEGIVKTKQTPFAELQSGDIVFQENESGQGKAIQLATQSQFTHCGLVIREGDKVMVYEAVQPVRIVSMAEWVKQGKEKVYHAKRLKNASEVITPQIVEVMKKSSSNYLGKNYDIYFNWSDDEIYCSEFVWKIYHDALAIDLCATRPLGDFHLDHPEVKRIMEQRYGDQIPWNEPMVSPGDIFNSSLLKEVVQTR